MGRQIKQFRIWLDHGGRLLWLRLCMLRLDAVAQIRSLTLLLLVMLVVTVVFFLGFISLLFGLNSVLTPAAKIWVFFGLAGFFGVLMLILLWWLTRLWRMQSGFMSDTLDAMAEDVHYLSGRYSLTHMQEEADHE